MSTTFSNANDSKRSGGPSPVSFDPVTLMKIKSLELRARAVVEGMMSGLHRSPYHGYSVEFSDYRPYTQGDDLRYLDWRLLARSDRRYIKRYEDETNVRCYLVLDNSRSMQFAGPGQVSKIDFARIMIATLAFFFARQRDAVGLLTFDEQIQELIPPRFRPGHLRRLLVALERTPGGTGTDIRAPLERLAMTFRKRGLVFLVSDLLTDPADLRRPLAGLRALGHEVMLLRVLDRSELTFDFSDASIFVDLESGKDLYVDPGAVRQAYRQKFAEHEQGVQRICADLGVGLQTMTTDQPLEKALFNLIAARLETCRSGRGSSQAGAVFSATNNKEEVA
ncbi:MAG: DUF58 domain-containing protein [Pirellulaceae bacterium]|nr:DUF58 domain-containing protein [Pirellulaceae bacterium]